jgi:protein O-GlcNAc transferase
MREESAHLLHAIQEVYSLIHAGNTKDAVKLISSWSTVDISVLESDLFTPLFRLGMQLARAKMYEPASIALGKAALLNPQHIEVQYNLGLVYALSGHHELALEHFDRALMIAPNEVDALINKAASLNDLGRYQEALAISDSLFNLANNAEAILMIRGIALSGLGRYQEALSAFDQILNRNSANVEAHVRRALALDELGDKDQAILAYERALIFDPQCVEALSNLGGLFREKRQFAKALAACESALKVNASFANAWINHGFTLADMGYHEQAIVSFEKAIVIDQELSASWVGMAFSRMALKQYLDAIAAFQKAMLIDPRIEFLLGPMIHAKMQVCDWENYDQLLEKLNSSLRQGLKVSPPFQIIGLVDDPRLIQTAARAWMADQHPHVFDDYQFSNSTEKSRIKLGYFSADFREHPVAQLIAGMIECHDRNQFEVIGFSWGPESMEPMRQRLESAFDRLIDIDSLSDQDAVALVRKHNIDIAIDLTGLTANCRPNLFAHRAAPIQVNYLGYPATMGAPYIDYIIADKVVIPEVERHAYDEQVLCMPYSFQANDSSKAISKELLKRSEFDLPEDEFIFCAFNNSFKITPPIFTCWMGILKAVPKSVLWLSIPDGLARQNLRKYAAEHGVSEKRLIFAERLPSHSEHLARYRLADLFLDTSPYGAHTTASDALWAGLPVLTVEGSGYASRVAASLLKTLNLEELVQLNLQSYQEKAIELANHPEKLMALKSNLSLQLPNNPLFNTAQYTEDIEKIFIDIYKKYQMAC